MKIVIMGNKIDMNFLSTYLSNRNINFIKLEYYERSIWNIVGLLKKILWGDIIHILSLKLNGIEGFVWLAIFLFLKILRKNVILHWMGTDVLTLSPMFGMFASKVVNQHLAYSTWLVAELKEKNIKSTWLPIIPPLKELSCNPLPDQFTVLLHLGGSETKIDFYGHKQLEQLIEEFPEIRFLIVGRIADKDKINSHNIQYYGLIGYDEMDKIHQMSSVLLRITEHDGLSFMVLEALGRGRYVIWSQKFPHCLYAKKTSEVITHLMKLKNINQINSIGHDFIVNNFDNDIWLDRLIEVYAEVLKHS